MDDSKVPNSKLSSTIALLAMLAAIAVAFLKPISNNVDTNYQNILDHDNLHGHAGVLADLSEISERFVGIENKFESFANKIDERKLNTDIRLLRFEDFMFKSLERQSREHAELRGLIIALQDRIDRMEKRNP